MRSPRSLLVHASALLAALAVHAGCGRAQLDLGARSAVATDGSSAGSDGEVAAGDCCVRPEADGGVDGAPDGQALPDAGGECSSAPECDLLHGRPPGCPNAMSSWSCSAGVCVGVCGPASCSSDCDCDLRSSCLGGTCQVANRSNQCCTNPLCPQGETCVLPGGGTDVCTSVPPPPPDGGTPDGGRPPRDAGMGSGDAGPPPPSGAVGSACTQQTMCMGNNAFCIDPSMGFPDGYCSAPCGRGVGRCPSGAACRQIGGGNNAGPTCLDVCGSNGDCRPGYACVALAPGQDRVCVPAAAGSTNTMGGAVGSGCGADADCGLGLVCLSDQNFPGGYCSKLFCDDQNNPCPANGACTPTPIGVPICLESCVPGSGTCRPDYQCLGFGAEGVCVAQN